MASYISDRSFTDYIHENLAIPIIYDKLNWEKVNVKKEEAEELDMQHGIDYVFKDNNGQLKTVQERFRESKYQQYSDFTIRYRRDENLHTSRIESEYYKMKADYFIYGITNCSKTNIKQCTDFIKYAVTMVRKKLGGDFAQIVWFLERWMIFCDVREIPGRVKKDEARF